MNKAAAEMKSRALSGAPFRGDRLWAGTFHSFGGHLLRDHGTLIDIPNEFDILDEEDQLALASEVGGSAQDLRDWSRSRCSGRPASGSVGSFGELYEAAKASQEALDFDDLVVRAAELLATEPDIAEVYGHRFNHLLVDEFQDTDASRFAIVRALAPHARTISVFADDDQAIMSFAGADRGNVALFMSELGAKRYDLTANYRCAEEIVVVANRLMRADPEPSGRVMRPARRGGEVTARGYPNETDEAEGIVARVIDLVCDDDWHNVAVLVRWASRADRIAAALADATIPVSDWRGHFIDGEARRYVAACLAVVRPLLAGRHEGRLCELAGIDKTRHREVDAVLDSLGDTQLGQSLVCVRTDALNGASPLQLVDQACDVVGAARPELGSDLAVLLDGVRGFSEHDPQYSLEHLLAELALGAGGQPPTESGGVKIATLHRTKGLEWPHVILAGVEQGTLPIFHATSERAISEERRLCFVGVCRAEQTLELTYASRVNGWAKHRSQFLREMDLP